MIRTAILLSMTAFTFLSAIAISEEVVNLYSARHYDTDDALYSNFQKETGIKVNLIEGGSDGLIERIVNEGKYSPADLLITVDAGRLWKAVESGVFQGVSSAVLSDRIPPNLRHPEGFWFGLSKRGRIIAYNKKRGLPENITNYEDLADQSLKGQVCMRSSSNIYNLSLMAALIEANGTEKAESWANGVVSNFARDPQGNDTAQLRAVSSGECGITVANTYYIGRLMGSGKADDKKTIDGLGFLFPNQEGRGAHVNISGGGVAKYAPNKENAIRFLEYLTEESSQKMFSEGNNEYPVIGKVSGPVASLGGFKEDSVNASLFGERQRQAVMVYDRAGWR